MKSDSLQVMQRNMNLLITLPLMMHAMALFRDQNQEDVLDPTLLLHQQFPIPVAMRLLCLSAL